MADHVYKEIEQFVCCLYGYSQSTSIDDVRYVMFCGKKGTVESHKLPPCFNTLRLHITRANYQAAIWQRALLPNPDILSDNGFGWTVTDSSVGIRWMECAPAPDSILELMSCNCSRSCTPTCCSYIKHGLPCTDMCRLRDCTNVKDSSAIDIDSDETDSCNNSDDGSESN